ncbi:hypothetical protein [Parapedobacter koreensis]|uniref:Uncharacterized protein n=1 Tax=Parapedobacter koreensis TaxID=332977 RepID=A0A1H7U0R2_9SPHI|nr:hypothetical protein [Parapedobacter koreensis]SEL90256.1 hypothetical protein SAMN05421740_11311 [Parapedobacter koreensis]
MNTLKYYACALLIMLAACDKKNDNVISPVVENDFPQILLLADEGDGELEDEEEFSFVITLADRIDPDREELGGKIVPLTADVTVHFEVGNLEGFDELPAYVLGATAFYELDDCTTSEDTDVDLNLVFDPGTGLGSVTFPQGVEEVEVVFETSPDLFDDDEFNTTARGLEIRLVSVDAGTQNVVINTANTFEYQALDDEGIYGAYELAITDAEQFAHFISLFGLVNEDVAGLSVADVEAIEIEVEYGEFKAVVVLKETEEIDECGEIETVNKEIEIEGEFEELEDDQLEGALEFVGDVELESGAEAEFTYQGTFQLDGDRLTLILQGEFDGEETEEITLILNK